MMGRLASIHADVAALADQPAPQGHNNPPEPSPFEAVKVHVEDLIAEARNWLDGAAIADQPQADTLSRLLDDLRKAEKAADAQRKVEAKVFDDGKAEVQARYKPLLSKTETAIDACKAALAKWLQKVEAEKLAIAAAARAAAEEAQRVASIAARMADSDDLASRERAEELATAAKDATRLASHAEKDKAHAVGGARAVTLRSFWSAEITDLRTACRHYYEVNPDAFRDLIHKLAMDDVRSGKRSVPGLQITEERRAV